MRLRPALLLTALAVLLATALPSQAAPNSPSLAAISDVRGIVYSNVNRPAALLAPDIARLKSIGVNHVTLYVYLFVDSPTGSSVKPGPTTPTDLELATVIDLVHAAGMTVAVAPLPWSNDGTWRGLFAPEDPDAFFDSWRFAIKRYAALSEQNDVELFSIGSEQNSLQNRTEQWRRTAAEARQVFSGPLTYLATAPSAIAAPNAVEVISFWDALDVISVSPYYSVSEQARPSYGEVRSAWESVVIPRLRATAAETGKKVLIAETGFVSAEYFGKVTSEPSPSLVPAPAAQADAYAAVLDVLAAVPDRSSFLLGIAWWDWDPYSASVASATFTPRGKPAECVLAQKWATGLVQTVAGVLPCGTR